MSNEYNEIICTVCLDSLKKKSHHSIIPKYTPSIISLSCSHTYHFKCIISWFTKSYSFLCPVCKNPDKVLLENFLPEIKNALHKEILENKCDYHTQEEYEEYCENCIKQGNMLKIIDLQQMLNAHNQRILDDDYNARYDISNIVNNVSENFYNFPNNLNNINEIINTEYEPYVTPITYSNDNNNNVNNNDNNNYYQQHNISSSTMHNRNLNFTTPTTETDIDNDNEIMERNIYSSSSLRNRYIFDDEDEDDEEQEQEQENEEIEIEKDEMIAYARGVINCILDDRDFYNNNNNNNNNNSSSSNNNNNNTNNNKSFIRNQNSLQRRRRRRHRSSVDLENIFKIVSGQNISYSSKLQEEGEKGEEEEEEEYENILLHHTTKPSFIHKYRFYIIFFILFFIGYLIFL